ncbi:ankyrin repeat and LEM domain-containing protein 2-like [Uloborus diversus]|uniref:ankyrin repeat and LEM domain-containing protein 2-like n=1 Tax=Uloborus diversus TaxID=327109 RepID=UPI00240940EC|nr:ankyrin repeat and LEM domain-containing protein 2-like [Uloborus diversus]
MWQEEELVVKNNTSVQDQDFIFRKPLEVELRFPREKFKKFYGVSLPSISASESSEPLVFEDKIAALKAIKTHKGARFKEFSSKEDALEFAKQYADLIPESPASVHNKQVVKASPESQSVFRQPTSQQTVQVRKAIEKGDFEKFTSAVWSNPLYLINGADSPTIMQEGTRYNALHVASKSNRPKMCEEILKTVEDPKFLKLLYPEDTEITRTNRIHHITDLYLNSVDKALLETPLHIAAKFGFLEVVKILLAHPFCDKTKINKYGSLAKELICTRCSSDCTELKEKLEKAFEGEYYIPVLRNETNVVQPIIGKPCTSESVKQARSPRFSKSDVHDPEYSIKAYAGPMTPSSAKNFYRLWKHPTSPASPIFSSPELCQNDVRFTDLEKGLERVGRKLAAELNVDWEEYWPALDAWVDLTSERGLCMLESYVKKFSNLFQEEEPENLSDDDHFVTPPSSPEKADAFSAVNYRPFCTPPHTPEDSDEELTNEENFSLQLSKEDIGMFRAVESVEIDSVSYPHICKWKQAVQKHLQSCPVKKIISSDSPISSFIVGDRLRSIRRPLF